MIEDLYLIKNFLLVLWLQTFYLNIFYLQIIKNANAGILLHAFES